MIKSSVIVTFLFLSVFFNTVKAQVFWSESFNHNCASKCKPDTYTGPNGTWTVSAPLSTEGSDPNDWYISYSEEGEPAGSCQGAFSKKNSCLHIATSADAGATYKKGAAGRTDKRVMSPTINCSGKSNIKIDFDIICFGDTTAAHIDHCDLQYSPDDGASWTVLQANLVSVVACNNLAMWRLISNTLPASANNNPKVKIGFRWINEATNAYDPSFAVDSIRLSASTPITTGPLAPGPFCACGIIQVPFTSVGTFTAGNIYTAELSDATGGFTTPVAIGTLSSTANTGVINAIIPCNTPSGTGYRIRVKSSAPAIVGADNGANLIINAPITVTVTPNPDTICLGQKVVLKASGADPGNYEWLTLPTTTKADSLTVFPTKDTTYIVIGKKGSCIDTAVAKIKVDIPPVVKVTNDTTCVGLPAMLVATGGGTYLWNTGSTNDTLIVPNQVKDTMYVVTVTKGHCTVKATGYVKVFPTITVSVNSPNICEGQAATLTATGALNYSWSTGQKTNPIIVTPKVTTTYTVTGTAGSCKDDAIATVTVKPRPDVKIATPASVCQGGSVFLQATGAATYIWLNANSKTDTVTVKPAFTTTYTVVGLSVDGCADSAQVVVTIDQRPNVVVNNPIICQGGTAILVASGATTYLWPATGETNDTIKVNPMMDTSYKVYGFNGACSDTAFGFVTVGVPVPVVATGKTEIYSCESTQLFANPTDGTYSWGTVGGQEGNIDCPECPSTTVTPPNTLAYYVVYTSPKGCIGRDTILVTVINTNSYFIPTGFSPNGDGINDVVQVHGRGIDHISLLIFDRVGEKVFETHELESGWDGTLIGVPMNDNVFVYRLEIFYCNGETLKETGNITLLK